MDHVDTITHPALAGHFSDFVPQFTQRPLATSATTLALCHGSVREETNRTNLIRAQLSSNIGRLYSSSTNWDVPDAGMAAHQRGHDPMRLDVSNAHASDLPFISALFLIRFDTRTGYAISWKCALPGIDLEGGVEYKSLPSGLHTVKEDLIYFVHEKHAGLSAFVSAPAAEESRNACMIAVGVLVPLTYGRLGRSWVHAENLKHLAEYEAFSTA